MHSSGTCLFVALIVSATSFAQSDLEIGGRRAAGMGGAGLAVVRDAAYRGFANPAAYAYATGLTVLTPTIGYHLSGISEGDLRDYLDTGSGNSGLDSDTLGDFAQTFGDDRVKFGLLGDWGLSLEGLHIGATGFASVTTVPNASLRSWVQGGSNPGSFAGTEQLDGYGIAAQTFDVALGKRMDDGSAASRAMGVRLRFVESWYSHYVATASDIDPNTGTGGSSPGPDMGGDSLLSAKGTALDVGYLTSLGESGQVMGALVVNNLLEPDVEFSGLSPVGAPDTINAFARTINAGVAVTPTNKTLFAFDLIDVGNSAGLSEIRFGGEFMMTPGFGFRAGYAGNTGWSVGATLMGFQVSYSQELPFGIASIVRF